jgi:type I restriction enzyme M protein
MLSNPPYGKSWASDLKYIKDGKDIIDPRFKVRLKNYIVATMKRKFRKMRALFLLRILRMKMIQMKKLAQKLKVLTNKIYFCINKHPL